MLSSRKALILDAEDTDVPTNTEVQEMSLLTCLDLNLAFHSWQRPASSSLWGSVCFGLRNDPVLESIGAANPECHLIDNRHFFLTVLGPGSQHGGERTLSRVPDFPMGPARVERERELCDPP